MSAMIPVEDYISEVCATLSPLPPVRLPLAQAHGLILAQDVTAALAVPPWTNSAMDGYAVRAADTAGASPTSPVTLPVSGDVPAGTTPPPLTPGTAMRIMTGAMLPDGANAVVKVEDTDQQPGPHPLPDAVTLYAEVADSLAVRHAGEDVAVGDLVLTAGTLLTATAVSALASVGCAEVSVIPRIRVAIISTGAELSDPGQPLTPGRIPDSNGLLLRGLALDEGAQVVSVERSADDAASLETCLAHAAEQADLILTSGGVSAGAFDPLTMLASRPSDALEHLADLSLSFRRVAMQPGKPQGFGWVRTRGNSGRQVPVLMLPGNPVSVLVSFTTIVMSALARLGGHSGLESPSAAPCAGGVPAFPTYRGRAACGWRTPVGRRQHVPVRVVPPPVAFPGVNDGAAGCVPDAETPDAAVSASGMPVADAVTADASDTGAAASDAELWVRPSHRLGSGSHLVASLAQAQMLAVIPAEVEQVEVGDVVTLLPLPRPSHPGGVGAVAPPQ